MLERAPWTEFLVAASALLSLASFVLLWLTASAFMNAIEAVRSHLASNHDELDTDVRRTIDLVYSVTYRLEDIDARLKTYIATEREDA